MAARAVHHLNHLTTSMKEHDMASQTYTSTAATGITLSAGSSPTPAAVPTGLIATRAVQLKDGWHGQIIVAEEIVWESDYGSGRAAEAEEDATYRVLDRIKRLMSDPHPNDPENLTDEDVDAATDSDGEST